MKDDSIVFDSKIRKIGGSYYILISPEMKKYLELRHNKNVKVKPEKGEHGKYASFWNPDIQGSEKSDKIYQQNKEG